MKVNIGKYPRKGNRRKTTIQIDRFDTWNADHTLATIILPMLIQLRSSKQGIPSDFATVGGEDYDAQESFDFYKETVNENFDKKCQEWDMILDKMIWSFQQIALEDYDDKYHHGKAEYDFVKTEKQYPNPVTGKMEDTFQMVDKNPEEHWYDHVGHQLHEQRIQEGLELFGKYFRALWD